MSSSASSPSASAATNDVDALIALKPDVVLYMPLLWDVDQMVQLLEAGINVISTANFVTGHSYGAEPDERAAPRCRDWGSVPLRDRHQPGTSQRSGAHRCRRDEEPGADLDLGSGGLLEL